MRVVFYSRILHSRLCTQVSFLTTCTISSSISCQTSQNRDTILRELNAWVMITLPPSQGLRSRSQGWSAMISRSFPCVHLFRRLHPPNRTDNEEYAYNLVLLDDARCTAMDELCRNCSTGRWATQILPIDSNITQVIQISMGAWRWRNWSSIGTGRML